MAVIDKLFVYVKTRAVFDTRLAAGEIKPTSIIFIEDTNEIWTHGNFYGSLGEFSKDLAQIETDIKAILRGEKIAGTDAIVVNKTVETSGSIPIPSISLLIDTNDKVLAQSASGLLTTLSLEKISAPAEGLASQYKLVGKDSTQLGATIDIPKDQFLKSAEFIASATEADKALDASVVVGDPYLKFVFQTTSADRTTYIPVKSLVSVYTAGNGIAITDNAISVQVKAEEAYLEVTADGISTKGIAELDARVGKARVDGDTPSDPTGIFKIIEDNERVTAEALVDLDSRVGAPTEGNVPATGVYVSIEKNASDISDANTKLAAAEASLAILTGADTVEGSVAKAKKDAQEYAEGLLVWAEITE